MSKDPKLNPPPKGGQPASLEDQVYQSSLAGDNTSLRRSNPLVTVPVTLASYVVFGGLAWFVATQTKAGQKVIKATVGIDLQEQDEAPPPPPPPPPPPAPVARPVAPKVEQNAPPPPPINPNQDIVPEIAPRELPKQDLSLAYQAQGSGGPGGPGGPGVAGAGVGGTGMAVAGSSVTKVVDFDFSQIKIKYQPPPPPYPAIAKLAKIQGTVVVQVTIGTDGVPIKAVAVDGPPQLRQAAESYAMQWKFEPAMLNGVPQTAQFKLTMPFRLR